MFLRNFFPDSFFESLYFPSSFPFQPPIIVSPISGVDKNLGPIVGKFDEKESLVDTYIEDSVSGEFSNNDSVIGRMDI
jgi:hypothetical protein